MDRFSIVFLVQRIGPYHHARLNAAASGGRLTVLETRRDDQVYAWAEVTTQCDYVRTAAAPADLPAALTSLNPDVLVCVGYSDPEIHQAMHWAVMKGVPMAVCSDSTYADEPRSRWREALKRRLLEGFSAGLVAGTRARDYLQHLGMESGRLFTAWDVVDNDYFAHGADATRREASRWRAELGLPVEYFLCVSRFVAKKNLPGLLVAYRIYARGAGANAWPLVLCGGGPQEAELKTQVQAAGLGDRVHFVGFKQYPELPAYYGLAGAFILPSLSDQWGLVVNEAMASGLPVLVAEPCGCVPDLVEAGGNGLVFDPAKPDAIAACLTNMAALSPAERAAMGRRSREVIAQYSLDAFATGLWAAARAALVQRKRGAGLLARLFLAVLTRRKATS